MSKVAVDRSELVLPALKRRAGWAKPYHRIFLEGCVHSLKVMNTLSKNQKR